MGTTILKIEDTVLVLEVRTGYTDHLGEFLIPVFFPLAETGVEDTEILVGFKNPVAAIRKIARTFLGMLPEGKLVLVEGKAKRQDVYEHLLRRLNIHFISRPEDDLFYKSALVKL